MYNVCQGRRVVAAVLLPLWLAACGAAAGREPDAAPPAKPPVLKPVRWQSLDQCYQDVFVDGSGRAWFLAAPRSFRSPRWRHLVCPELPAKVVDIPGANLPLGFDGRDRFWEISDYGLCCSDIPHDKFFQRQAIGSAPNRRYRVSEGGVLQFPPFCRFMFEHSSGRLYFVDAQGGHVLDGDRWSYQEFSPPLMGDRYRFARSAGLDAVEGAAGEVYLWSMVGANHVLWVHDGAAWKHYTPADEPALAGIGEVYPQPDGSIRIRNLLGQEATVRLPGRTPQGAMPPQKHDRLRDLRNARYSKWSKPQPLADFTGEELSAKGKFLAQDGQGRVYFDTAGVCVFDPRQREDAPQLKYECFPAEAEGWGPTAAMDSEGRLWARLAVKEHPFLSSCQGGQWTDSADPTGWNPQRYPGQELVRTTDWRWMMASRAPFHSPSSSAELTARLRTAPGMASHGILRPLAGGAMLAVEWDAERAFLFDGREWNAYDGLKALVENNYAWLRKHLDNGGGASGATWTRAYPDPYLDNKGQPVACDATGHIWVAGGAYDGRKWDKTPPGHVLMNAAGDRVIAGGILHDFAVWPPKELAVVKGRWWFDRQGRAWSDSPQGMCRFQDGRFHDLKVGSTPLLEDSDGRCWCASLAGPGTWCLLLPDGTTSETFTRGSLGPLVEQGRGVVWSPAGDGLLRLHVAEPKGGKPRIVLDQCYPRLVTLGPVCFLGVDEHDNLWLATIFAKSNLYRIELPPLKGEKP